MANITPRKRTCILTLSQHCNCTQRATASMVDVSQKSVSRMIWLHAETGSVVPRRKEQKTATRIHERVVLNCRKI